MIIDQIIKIWVKTTMQYEEVGSDWGFFRIYFIENNGMAFGKELGGDAGKLALSLFRVVAICLIGWYLVTLIKQKAHKGLILSISLIFAGAFGNIIDSVFYGLIFDQTCSDPSSPYCLGQGIAQMTSFGEGYSSVFFGRVVDMFQFQVIWPDWVPYLGGGQVFPPIFNFADAAISIGVIVIIIRNKAFFPQEKAFDWNIKNWFKKKSDIDADGDSPEPEPKPHTHDEVSA